MSNPEFDPTDKVVNEALDREATKTDEMFKDTHLDKPEKRNVEEELGWNLEADSMREFSEGLGLIPKPEPTAEEKAAAQMQAIEDAYAGVRDLEPDTDYVMQALQEGELDFLPPDERLAALSRIDVAETRVLGGDYEGALTALGGDRDALGYLLSERLDQDDAEGLAEFMHESAVELDTHLREQAHREVMEVVDANPILQDGPGARMLQQALGNVQLSAEPGSTKAIVEGVARMANEEARIDREVKFLDAFDKALPISARGDRGVDIWPGAVEPTEQEAQQAYTDRLASAFEGERHPYDISGEEAKAALDAKIETDREWREMQQRILDRAEEERIRELTRKPGR